jgi:ADP-ribose pyrophosphatase YjhB (NUDIX family)
VSKIVTSSDIHGNRYEVSVQDLGWRPSVYAIVVHHGKILLTKQHGTYHLPGGVVEFGETLQHAVAREVQEETGIVVTDPKLVDCISGYFTWSDGKKDYHSQTILLFYQCMFSGGELSMDGMEEDEKSHGEMPEWISLKDLDTIKAGSTEDWRAVVHHMLQLQK